MCALVRNDMFIYDIAKEITMKYGFIGCGNMGGAIARALSKSTTDILVTDRSGKAGALAGELNIGYTDIADIAASCDRIFLAVKPHMMKGVLTPLKKVLSQRKPLLITMAADDSMQFYSHTVFAIAMVFLTWHTNQKNSKY